MDDAATSSQHSDAFWQEVEEAFAREPVPVLPPPPLPPPPPKPFFTKRRVILLGAAAVILSPVLWFFWVLYAPISPTPVYLFRSPLFIVRSWITLKTSVEGYSRPDRRVTDHWMPGTKLFVVSYTARYIQGGGAVPDHRWAIVKIDPNDESPKYARFDEIAPSLPPQFANGTVSYGKSPRLTAATPPTLRMNRVPAESAPEFDPSGLWHGWHQCGGVQVGTEVQISVDRAGRVSGTREFYPTPGDPARATGSFHVSGIFQRRSREISLIAGDWIKQPPGYLKCSFVGAIDSSGERMAGIAPGCPCGRFELQRR